MKFQIITFYEFREIDAALLVVMKDRLLDAMHRNSIKGTMILATEGFNGTLCGEEPAIAKFVASAEEILAARLDVKRSLHDACPFRRIEVKIRPEIVTLKRRVDLSLGQGTHVTAAEWNSIISDPSVVVLDTRNDYEFRNGTFKGAINPGTEKFSDLPAFVEENLDPEKHRKVAMFCTGGVRCEKFAPYLKQIGFKEVFQLDGGILRYLEQTSADETLWEGECFVFDDRITVDSDLRKGTGPDYSQD